MDWGKLLSFATVALGAFQIVSSFAQASAIEDQNEAELRAAVLNAEAAREELSRQQEEVREREEEQVSDRIRSARKELATVTLAGLERGTGLNTIQRMNTEVAYYEDLDISRIRNNAEEDWESLEARKRSAQQNVTNTETVTRNSTDTAYLSARLGIASTGLQIGTSLLKQKVGQQALANTL